MIKNCNLENQAIESYPMKNVVYINYETLKPTSNIIMNGLANRLK